MSHNLSISQSKRYDEGKTLIEDSKYNDADLKSIVNNELCNYAKEQLREYNFAIIIVDEISTKKCYEMVKSIFPDFPEVNYTNDKTSMRPDGGIMFAVNENGKYFPILISEDKVQGTNDSRKANNLTRQSTGNAIERGAKNINFAKTLCLGQLFYPYVVFASGCDFHHTETISRRLEQMTGLMPNNYIDVGNKETSIEEQLDRMIYNINIMKRYGDREYATICVKAHKWDEFPHGASKWTKEERIQICKKVIDQAVEEIKKTL